MNVLPAFIKLIRWPNLLFIALTQLLFYYCIVPFVYGDYLQVYRTLSPSTFYLLVLASVLIAAAGYIINDYFDLNIDLVNKPSRIIIDRFIKRRIAILLHITLSFSGFVISAYIGYIINNIYIPVFNLVSIIMLWLYSTSFKKELLAGNVIISLLTAWVILVLMLAEYTHKTDLKAALYIPRLLRVSFLYAGFAFIISLVREVIKDMEDIEGDRKYGCRTMPIKWGIPVSKVFAAVWLVVLTGALLIVNFYIWSIGWWMSAIYSACFIIAPLLLILKKLYLAQTAGEFHHVSSLVKFAMFTGILSMIFFRFYS
jgi:4-hydroxybenzoate polyprenyltransferase